MENNSPQNCKRNIPEASRLREISSGIRENGSIAYHDDIMEAVGKGLFFVDLDYPIVQKSIEKLEDKGYKVKTFNLPPLPPEKVDYYWRYHRISW